MLRPIASLRLIATFVGLFVFIVPVTQTGAADFDSAYASGVDAFEKGNYDQALRYLLEARSLGMDEPSLHYNLGATYYKLGHYDDARRSFLRTARDPDLAPLAYYNLGLCSLRVGDEDAAYDWFERVLRTTDNPRLRELALDRLSGKTASRARAAGSGFLSAAVGYDSNVLLLSDSDILSTTKRDDTFLDLFAYGSRRIAGNLRTMAFDVDGAASLLKYAHLSDYDIADLRVGGIAVREDGWRKEAGAHLDYSFVGAETFTREELFSLAASRVLSPVSRVRLRYEYSFIDAIDQRYHYLDGHRQHLEARATFHRSGKRLDLTYEFEINDRRDLQSPLFASYSPIRNGVRVLGIVPLTGRLDLEAEARYLHSRYRDPNEISPGVLARRIDNRLSAGLRLVYSLRGDADVSLEYIYNNSRSNISRYEYVENVTTLGISRSF